jgi:ankyrin repeat protein
LHLAGANDHKEIIELLIAKGADLNAKDVWEETLLFKAATKAHKEIAELLIANGADVNAQDDDWLPLHGAAEYGQKEMAELLIAAGADVNAKTKRGKTPLDWAIQFKQTETTALLRKHGGKTGKELKAEGK